MAVDLNIIKSIPIQDVAVQLGIKLAHNKRNTECFRGHDKKTKSLSFNVSKNYFHCFGCGIAGSPIDLVMKFSDCDFKTAVKWLSDKFVIRSQSPYVWTPKVAIGHKVVDVEREYQADPELYLWIIDHAGLSQTGLCYLQKGRGFELSTIERFKIRDIEDPKDLLETAKKAFGLERLVKSGLWKKEEYGSRPVWWKHTVIFPFISKTGEISYLQGRIIGDERYRYINLNGVESVIFNEQVLTTVAPRSKIYIAEGIPDAIWLSQKGLACLGVIGASNFKDQYAVMLVDYDVYVVPDNDQGGDVFLRHIKSSFHTVNKTITEVTFNKEYKDVSDYFWRKNG